MKRLATGILALGIGATMVSFGANQIARPHKWVHYIPRPLADVLPVRRGTAMRVHGTGNVSLGLLLVLLHRRRLPWLLAGGWWAFVAPVCGRIDWRDGIRDAAILSSIFAVLVSLDDSADRG